MKYPWLFVGAKVVCVDADLTSPRGRRGNGTWNPLVLHAVYTIKDCFYYAGQLTIRLREQSNPDASGGDWGYRADRFAPVTTINTDAAVSQMRELMQKARDENKSKVRA